MSIEWDLGSYDAQANSLSGAYSDVNGADIDFTVDFASTEYDYRVEMNDSGGGQAWLFAYEDGSSIYAGPLE